MAQSIQAKLRARWPLSGSVMVLAAAVSGCQSGGNAFSPYPVYDYSQVAPASSVPPTAVPAQQAAAPASAPAYNPVPYQALEASALELKERLERVEKAMLRLDRRMQLVERNELSRMGAQTSQIEPAAGGTEEQVAMRALNIGPGTDLAAGDFRPVASRNETITSALQAAPSLGSSEFNGGSARPAMQLASRSGGLPSLADPAPSAARSLQPGNSEVAIWTVKYEPSKVWPDRTQLPFSRDVVEALRESGSSTSLTLYARGKNANAVEFRERVKALSRYLSKVSSLESVPIAAMPAPHLDDQTIEILVTH